MKNTMLCAGQGYSDAVPDSYVLCTVTEEEKRSDTVSIDGRSCDKFGAWSVSEPITKYGLLVVGFCRQIIFKFSIEQQQCGGSKSCTHWDRRARS